MDAGKHLRAGLSLCAIYRRGGSVEMGSFWFVPLRRSAARREANVQLICGALDWLAYERAIRRCHAQNSRP
ncbi:hypothetical protein GCM10011415_36370 [Salipiger pallidus]|uniref:Uncharacterized protein n=1 Tax=Salipiger pallidus TaxID=1775170 RepID=A0A8J2ZMJ2_9RHOB|nr:hypothetical protein GCM10011415_36370 [Salipiger pallidus]